jgi:MYXO-CTERM domain-containing protein
VCNGVDGDGIGIPGADGADGSDGEGGTDGENRTDGEEGTDGVNGLSALVATTVLTPGDDCTLGGTLFESGADSNGNATLDESEVNGTATICNGAAGEAGTNGESGGCSAASSRGGNPAGGILSMLVVGLLLRRKRSL